MMRIVALKSLTFMTGILQVEIFVVNYISLILYTDVGNYWHTWSGWIELIEFKGIFKKINIKVKSFTFNFTVKTKRSYAKIIPL
jgi:hypothetical protein